MVWLVKVTSPVSVHVSPRVRRRFPQIMGWMDSLHSLGRPPSGCRGQSSSSSEDERITPPLSSR